ncbi:hypothetical protein BpHYR1_006191 [Brachionus plicatilis]|uniref:Uncharacterized protein n=1 Tax=Brachionus plicatilis TaxID=10195 RepID=A0A3M7RQF7_BRAPC|nr:hypothetical protein BpHYR1_006191 [Brachionus plicatilis]
MLSLIDLPIIEHLLTIDEQNDVEYCEAIQSFDAMLINNMNSLNLNESMDGVFNKSNIKYINKSLDCLAQSFDMKQCDAKDEWRKSVLEVLEFIDWHKSLCNKNQPKINDRDLSLVLMRDIELYNLVFNYYTSKKSHFLHDSFQPLFSNILIFIKKSHYSKALEILNLASLLLLKQTQAELKRLLKFMYLTANSSHAPRLCEEVSSIY